MASRKRSSNTQDLADDSRFPPKKTKVNSDDQGTAKVDANGDKYWEISKMRRVTISSFRGKTMVNLREYYEKDGQELPGKKVGDSGSCYLAAVLNVSSQGISMPVAQFSALVKILPDLEQALQSHGESLPRPLYSEGGAQSDDDDAAAPKSNKGGSPSKQNIEATSEEDESEA